MGFKTSYKPTTLRDMIPYLQNIKQRGEETVAACPVCEAGDSNGHHLYIRESGGKLLAYCQKCNAKLPEIVGGGQNNHSKGGEKRPILGKLRNQQLSLLNLFSNRFA